MVSSLIRLGLRDLLSGVCVNSRDYPYPDQELSQRNLLLVERPLRLPHHIHLSNADQICAQGSRYDA